MTAEAQAIVRAVGDLCNGQGPKYNYSLLHMVDVFKGSRTKKIVDAGNVIFKEDLGEMFDYSFLYLHSSKVVIDPLN